MTVTVSRHSNLLEICGQQITDTDMSENCDSEFLATDLRAQPFAQTTDRRLGGDKILVHVPTFHPL